MKSEVVAPVVEAQVVAAPVVVETPRSTGTAYIANTNTKMFHLPSCYRVEKIYLRTCWANNNS